jgi:Na+/proline symporter
MKFIDYALIAGYLVFSLSVSLFVFRKASKGRVSYFLGNRSIPWWWAGISIAGTTFAADTPLAVTGIVAKQGFAGNWIWLSWIIMHAAAAIFFASMWRRSEVLTDAQIISLRYSGRAAQYLRLFKSGFYAIFFNCLILAWVIRAMVKILSPFLVDTPIAGYEAYLLTALVAIYSATGGLRAVVITDLFQLLIAVFGSYTLAYLALSHVGGFEGLAASLSQIYGESHRFTNFLPQPEDGVSLWTLSSATLFFFYLVTQAFSNSPADGGGYLMQRLAACDSSAGAKKAAFLFIFIQYVVRLWPWIITALVALIVFPLGQEGTVFDGAYAYLATDREAAYPGLMKLLLPPGLLGLVVVGMLAAFMSTVDTHLNWGSSYIVNDFMLRFFPKASAGAQVLVGRVAALSFAVIGVVASFYVQNVVQAWKWLSLFGACFAVPTLMRWFWWRINSFSEFFALAFGLAPAFYFSIKSDIAFPQQLVTVAAFGFVGTLFGAFAFRSTHPDQLKKFVETVKPFGFWGAYANSDRQTSQFKWKFGQYVMLVSIVISTLFIGQSLINGRFHRTAIFGTVFLVLVTIYEFMRRRLSLEVRR